MSRIGWRWYNTNRQGALVPFNSAVPHVPNEPVKAECLTCTDGWQDVMWDVMTNRLVTPNQQRQFTTIEQRRLQETGQWEVRRLAHDAPVFDCTCGHYLFAYSEDALGLPHVSGYFRLCRVLAAVEWWGRYVEHEFDGGAIGGYRVEWTMLRGIVTFGRRVHPVYEVDRAPTIEALVERWEEPDGE